MDKSPQVNSAFSNYLDKVQEAEEINESGEEPEGDDQINVSFRW